VGPAEAQPELPREQPEQPAAVVALAQERAVPGVAVPVVLLEVGGEAAAGASREAEAVQPVALVVAPAAAGVEVALLLLLPRMP